MLRSARWIAVLIPLFVLPFKGVDGQPGELVYVATDDGVAVVDSATGGRMLDVDNAMPAGDWSQVITTIPATKSTLVQAVDPTGAGTIAWRRVDGRLRVRAVSRDGSLIALMPTDPRRYGEDGVYAPARRRKTRIVVTRLTGTPRTYDLAANLEPEAFSADGLSLFVIQYKPALHPDRYRVRRLDLTTGELGDVFTSDKLIQGDMRGTAFDQAVAPDGSKLYTLYRKRTGETFVHLLDLVNQTAQCVLLPDNFGTDAEAMTITARPDGAVFVVDPAVQEIAELDPVRHGVAQSRPYKAGGAGAPAVAAATSGAIYVASGDTVTQLREPTLEPAGRWTFDSEVSAVYAGANGLLYVAVDDRLLAVSVDGPARGVQPLLDVTLNGIRGIGNALPVTAKGSVQCAC